MNAATETEASNSPGARLRSLLAGPDFLALPCAFDALSARIIERAGVPATYVTGYGVAAVLLGAPDAGLASATEVVEHAGRIVDAVSIPVWCDVDQGWGPPVVAARVARLSERAGLAGIDIDDQVTEACPYLPIERELIEPQEMVDKIRAVRDAVEDDDFVVTVKASVLNTCYERDGTYRDEFARRAETYVEAGADTVFTGWRTVEDLEHYAKVINALDRPAVAVMGSMLPQVPTQELRNLGYRVALYPVDALYAAVKAQMDTIRALQERGDLASVLDSLISHDDFMDLVGIDELRAMLGQDGASSAPGAAH